MTNQKLQGTNKKSLKKSGFRVRMRTKSGRKIIQSRRRKNRKRLTR